MKNSFLLLFIVFFGCGQSLQRDPVTESEAVIIEGAEDFVGEYQSEADPLDNSAITLFLKSNGRTKMVIQSTGNGPKEIYGEWSRSGQSSIRVVQQHTDRNYEEVLELESTPAGLKAEKFDKELYGRQGFTLAKR